GGAVRHRGGEDAAGQGAPQDRSGARRASQEARQSPVRGEGQARGREGEPGARGRARRASAQDRSPAARAGGLSVLAPGLVRRSVREALEEDVGERDASSEATVGEAVRARGVLLARQDLVVAGLEVAVTAFRLLDPQLRWVARCRDGETVGSGSALGTLEG